ncbi:unnamed protein product [Prorocentrum cordatum]|uniref:Peptidase A1 domain-containing protein n=1 Tax=Prorocentrum cordatum TaxID=2364126 RepID=A0ABN9UH45_9DINO|nr:unnamed protein product [Polarella glacialis]
MARASLPLLIALARALGATSIGLHQQAVLHASDGSRGCAALENRGTHFTIDVDVGTPSQRFSVVADTGSNSLIIPSCQCQSAGKCDKTDRCFIGSNKSSSFHLEVGDDQEPVSMVLSFGSGQIQAVVAQEQVRVGQVNASLKDGLLLMTDRALNINGPFEGILGLGLPQPPTNWTAVQEQESKQESAVAGGQSMEDIIKQIVSQMGASGPEGGQAAPPEQNMRKALKAALEKPKRQHRDSPTGFLEQAGIGRFSMCFNDGGDGVLRIGEPPLKHGLGGMGTQHWGVDFRGISVGSKSVGDVLFCHGTNMTKGQRSPCGAIPDSGTTMLMGPKEHIGALLEGICDGWDRCRQNFTKLEQAEQIASEAMSKHYGMNPFNMQGGMSKSDVLQLLLMDCESWGHGGFDELPDLHFHIRGSDGKAQALKIPGHMYVMEVSGDQAESALKLLEGVRKIPADTRLAKSKKKVCTPMFGEMDYQTSSNGPVWILGTPIFYEYVVGYDMKTSPPAMSFASQSEQPCGSCKPTVNLAMSRETHKVRSPRQVSGPPRVPQIDTTKPL